MDQFSNFPTSGKGMKTMKVWVSWGQKHSCLFLASQDAKLALKRFMFSSQKLLSIHVVQPRVSKMPMLCRKIMEKRLHFFLRWAWNCWLQSLIILFSIQAEQSWILGSNCHDFTLFWLINRWIKFYLQYMDCFRSKKGWISRHLLYNNTFICRYT